MIANWFTSVLLDFIDERFYLLAGELDSIEGDKEKFKQQNNLALLNPILKLI